MQTLEQQKREKAIVTQIENNPFFLLGRIWGRLEYLRLYGVSETFVKTEAAAAQADVVLLEKEIKDKINSGTKP